MEMRHYLTGAGKKEWHLSTIQGIIRNEKYVGDLVQQKTYTIDFLSHKRIKNKGNKTKYESKGVIPAIIDRETFDLAQSIIEKRRKGVLDNNEETNSRYLTRYPLSGKLICFKCGETLKRRYWNYTKPCQRTIMLCNGFIQGKKKCNSKGVVLDVIEEAIRDAIRKFVDLVSVHHSGIKHNDNSECMSLLDEVTAIKGNLEKLIERQLNARSDFKRNALDKKYEEYSEILENKSVLLNKLQNKQKDISLERDRIDTLIDFLDSDSKELTDEVIDAFLTRIIIIDNQHMAIIVAKDKSVTGEQIASNRKDIAQMNGVLDGDVEIRIGIKVYKMSYKVVVI